jgi:ATP-dependent RNA helicase DDX56/DBP9
MVCALPLCCAQEEEDTSKPDLLAEFYYVIPQEDKLLLMYTLLQLKLLKGKTLVFVQHIDTCFRLKLFLERFSIRSAVLNSELPHASRRHILEQFNQGVFHLLIATSEDDLLAMHAAPPATTSSSGSSQGKKGKSKSRRDTDYGVGRGFDFRKLANGMGRSSLKMASWHVCVLCVCVSFKSL